MRDVYLMDNWMSQDYYPDAVNGWVRHVDGTWNNSPCIMVSQQPPLSAVGKKSFMTGFKNCGEWREKPVREWSCTDVLQWIGDYAKENKCVIEDINISEFRVDGVTLLRMSEQEFVAKDREYGLRLFDAVHARKAAGKKTFIDDFMDCSEWREKPITKWTSFDVVQWICENAKETEYDIERINIEEFRIDGITLSKMSEQDFLMKDGSYGQWLYYALHAHKYMEDKLLGKETDIRNLEPMQPLDVIRPVSVKQEITDLCGQYNTSSGLDLNHSDSSDQEEKKVVKDKRRVGRPPKPAGVSRKCNRGKKCGKVWEFIRDLLQNPLYCPSYICWDDADAGVFRFVRSQEVAGLWGRRRNEENSKMTYEKFSRAMRHNYKTNFLQPVLGRRLVYKFGSRATGWQVRNPNSQKNL